MSASPALKATILGCGSSGGVPRLGGFEERGDWGACDPSEPKNRRRRCAILVERAGPNGVTRMLVDAGPDIREQLLAARASWVDAVLFTHDHADHTHGLDDLRQIVFVRRRMLDVWADAQTEAVLRQRFGYAFETPEGSDYPPILEMNPIAADRIDADAPIVVAGAGGRIAAWPFTAQHGRQTALGFRIGAPESARVGGLAYLPDANILSDAAFDQLGDLDLFIVDALRHRPHPSHANVETALAWIARAAPKRAVLTNLHNDLDYAALSAELPPGVAPAFDGLVVNVAAT